MTGHQAAERVLARVDADRDELVALTADLIRIPSVDPPGDRYRECAELFGRRLDLVGMDVQYLESHNRPEYTAFHPRVNVVAGQGPSRKCISLTSHVSSRI